jgi:hypothetical protein
VEAIPEKGGGHDEEGRGSEAMGGEENERIVRAGSALNEGLGR